MAEGKICVCPQCGKKFKLKAGFSAASFACSACGATVWLEGKPPKPGSKRTVQSSRGAKGGRGRRKTRAAAGKSRRPAPAARGRRRQEEPEEEEEGRRPRYQKQSSNNTALLVVGLIAVVAIGAVIFLMAGGKDDKTTETATQPIPMNDEPAAAGTGATVDPTGATGVPVTPTTSGDLAQPAESDDLPRTTDDPKPAATDPGEPAAKAAPPKLGGTRTKKSSRKSKWDPPASLGHLESTPPEMRKQIDELIALMMDPQAGKDSLDAKAKLSALGKPAFLPVLGAMAKVRDTITDNDSLDERLIESSLKLADICLREMDGYLNAKEKGTIKPGTDKKYIEYILRLHYKRWQQVLQDMETMPGPYDPASQFSEDDIEKG